MIEYSQFGSPIERSNASKAGTTSALREAFIKREGDREPLHLKLRHAILTILAEGVWSSGDKLPAERALADELAISLGTVQKTLTGMAQDGILVRRHGYGTFVAGDSSQSSGLIHFRFRGDQGRPLATVFAEAIDRQIIVEPEPWSVFLTDSKTVIRITRRINVADEFDCISDFYLDADHFSSLMKMPMEQLHKTIIRRFIAKEFNTPTLAVSQSISCGEFPARISRLMKKKIRHKLRNDIGGSFMDAYG